MSLGNFLLHKHAKQYIDKLKKENKSLPQLYYILNKSDFAIMLAMYDGYENKIPKCFWW